MKRGNGKQDEVHKHVSFHSLNLYFCKEKGKEKQIPFIFYYVQLKKNQLGFL
jgi:hypothetical protein